MAIKALTPPSLLRPAHFGATGITPACCVPCRCRNVVIKTSKLCNLTGKIYTGSISVQAVVGATNSVLRLSWLPCGSGRDFGETIDKKCTYCKLIDKRTKKRTEHKPSLWHKQSAIVFHYRYLTGFTSYFIWCLYESTCNKSDPDIGYIIVFVKLYIGVFYTDLLIYRTNPLLIFLLWSLM